MKQIVFYLVTVLIWGSTWIAIKFQLGDVDPMVSVIYRFGLAAAVLFAVCKVRGLTLRFSLQEHCFMALLGGCLFSLNYWFIYQAEIYLTSGITAVVFSSLVFFNIANNRLFRGVAVSGKTLWGAVVGIIGICLIYQGEIGSFNLADQGVKGLIFALSSVLLASLGNITSARNTKAKIPVIQANAFGMAYGTLALGVIALCLGKPFAFPFSLPYIGVFNLSCPVWLHRGLWCLFDPGRHHGGGQGLLCHHRGAGGGAAYFHLCRRLCLDPSGHGRPWICSGRQHHCAGKETCLIYQVQVAYSKSSMLIY